MKEIKGSVMIMAPAERVWAKVADFGSYSQWNPWLRSMNGELKVGSVYAITAQPPGRKEMSFKAKLAKLEEGREALFQGKIMGGMVKEDHLISVDPIDASRTILSQNVRFSGSLVALAGGTIQASKKRLDEMNAILKKMCEEGK
jgi:hypothetical protein